MDSDADDEALKALTDADRLVREAPRELLPVVLGRLVELEARARLRLAEPAAPARPVARILDGDEAARVAGSSKRWILGATKGLRFRCDLSRKQPRFQESGLLAWLGERRPARRT